MRRGSRPDLGAARPQCVKGPEYPVTGSPRATGIPATHHLADVDVPVILGDVGDDDVQARAILQRCVDERGREVHASPRAAKHPFDQVPDLVGREDRRGQLGDASSGDEDLARLVDPVLPPHPRTVLARAGLGL